MMPHLLCVIAANGLGHFRRTIGIVDRLMARRPNLQLTIVSEEWQWRSSSSWPAARRVRAHARHRFGVVSPGVAWTSKSDSYADGRLLDWVDRLRKVREVETADIVLSDNLVGTLDVRKDAVLLGSFLWSDVLEAAHPDVSRVVEFARHERALLTALRPPMLCVEDIAMPSVRERTNAVALGWMCETLCLIPREAPDAKPRVLVLGGNSDAASQNLDAIAADLSSDSSLEVVVHRGRRDANDAGPRFEDADIVVARPGIGTVTACIGHAIPMVLFSEGGNLEMDHNAGLLESIGVATTVGVGSGAAKEAVHRVLEPMTYSAMSNACVHRERNGLIRAVDWLEHRL